MKRFTASLLMCATIWLGIGSTHAQPLNTSPQPTLQECPSHLVCFTPEEAHRINVKLIKLERDVKVAKISRIRRFGTTVGCGGTYGFVNDDVDLSCGVMWGFRF